MNHRPDRLRFVLMVGLLLTALNPTGVWADEVPPQSPPPPFDATRIELCPVGAGRRLTYGEARWCTLPMPPSCPGLAESCAMERNPTGLRLEDSPRYPIHDVPEEQLEELRSQPPPEPEESDAPGPEREEGGDSNAANNQPPEPEESAAEPSAALKWVMYSLLGVGLLFVLVIIARSLKTFRLPTREAEAESSVESDISAADAEQALVSAPAVIAAAPVELTLAQKAAGLHDQGRTAEALQLLATGTIQVLAGRQWIRIRRSATFGDYLAMLSGRPASRSAARDVFRAAEIGRYAPERASHEVWVRALNGFERLQQGGE